MYQILIKIPNAIYDAEGNIIEQHSNPNEVFQTVNSIDSRVGQIHISNSEWTGFGWMQETSDVSNIRGLPEDVEIIVSETNHE